MSPTIVYFNSFDFGSTGTLCNQLILSSKANGFNTIFIVGNVGKNRTGDYYINESNSLFVKRLTKLHRILFGNKNDVGAFVETSRVIKYLKQRVDFNQNVIFHFHNVQYMSLNIFKIIKFASKHNIKIVWTLHDCWPFTGGCNYFSNINCLSWKQGKCSKCKLKIKNSKRVFKNKVGYINRYANIITFVAPSKWIKDLFSSSKLTSQCILINNGIDSSKWPLVKGNESDKIRLISVASPWDERKGLRFLNELADLLPENYSLTVVGLNDDNVTNRRIVRYPKLDQQKLAELYANSDVFVNPTLEDNFPTVNIEALLSGLYVVSFDTGGSCEIFDSGTGICVKSKNAFALRDALLSISTSKISRNRCRERGMLFNVNKYSEEHISLYMNILGDKQND